MNWTGLSWIILLILTIVFYISALRFVVFPDKYKVPFTIVMVLIIAIMGFFSLKKMHQRGKPWKKIIVSIINCILSVFMLAGTIYLPILEARMKGLFVEPGTTQEIRINAYVMTEAYKSSHSSTFTKTETSTSLDDYKNAKFIIEKQVDQENEAYAVSDIKNQLNTSTLTTTETDGVMDAVAALYKGTGDVLILNENYENTIEEVPGYENFKTDTQILYTTIRTIQVATPTPSATSVTSALTSSSFMVFIAGSDSRESVLTQYTRTDVDMLMTVDPINHQVLLISMPRDWYIKNPALGNNYDKFTHLGNNGMQNSIDGLNQEYGFDYINNYVLVNFVTFYNIVEALGGIDISNPYAFTCTDVETVDGVSYGGSYTFEQGSIHLDGNQALTYVRERHALANGDYGRNEHQAIVLQGIINKLTSKSVITNFNSLLEKLQGNFLTSLSSDDIYSLAEKQLNDGGSWNMVSYHLGGVGDYNTTASMGSMQLYVSYPIAEQIEFAKEQMTKVMNGEKITQDTLPANDETVFLPN